MFDLLELKVSSLLLQAHLNHAAKFSMTFSHSSLEIAFIVAVNLCYQLRNTFGVVGIDLVFKIYPEIKIWGQPVRKTLL